MLPAAACVRGVGRSPTSGPLPATRPALGDQRASFLQCLLDPTSPPAAEAPRGLPQEPSREPSTRAGSELCREESCESAQGSAADGDVEPAVRRRGGSAERGRRGPRPHGPAPARRVSFKVRAAVVARRTRALDSRLSAGNVATLAHKFQALCDGASGSGGSATASDSRVAVRKASLARRNALPLMATHKGSAIRRRVSSASHATGASVVATTTSTVDTAAVTAVATTSTTTTSTTSTPALSSSVTTSPTITSSVATSCTTTMSNPKSTSTYATIISTLSFTSASISTGDNNNISSSTSTSTTISVTVTSVATTPPTAAISNSVTTATSASLSCSPSGDSALASHRFSPTTAIDSPRPVEAVSEVIKALRGTLMQQPGRCSIVAGGRRPRGAAVSVRAAIQIFESAVSSSRSASVMAVPSSGTALSSATGSTLPVSTVSVSELASVPSISVTSPTASPNSTPAESFSEAYLASSLADSPTIVATTDATITTTAATTATTTTAPTTISATTAATTTVPTTIVATTVATAAITSVPEPSPTLGPRREAPPPPTSSPTPNASLLPLKPNVSFLWRCRGAPPLPPRSSLPAPAGEPESEYDDVLPPSASTAVWYIAEDVEYQAVGESAGAALGTEELYEWCGGEAAPYDDCEDVPRALPVAGMGTVAAGAEEKQAGADEDIYDDIGTLLPGRGRYEEASEDSRSNCYESIGGDFCCGGVGGVAARGVGMFPGSSASSVASASPIASSCDQSNSLYERASLAARRPPSAALFTPECGCADSCSASCSGELVAGEWTSGEWSEASDEWTDLELSDAQTLHARLLPLLLQDRSRHRKSPCWSRKVRNQWTKHQNNNEINKMRGYSGNRVNRENVLRASVESHYRRPRPRVADEVFITSTSILYFGDVHSKLMQCQKGLPLSCNVGCNVHFITLRSTLYLGDTHEIQEMVWFAEKEGPDSCSNLDDHNYETLDDLTSPNNTGSLDDDNETDSFDSHNSDCESSPKDIDKQGCAIENKELPDPPVSQNIYGISKIAEAAGKKMLELGRSLRRMRSRHSIGNDVLLCSDNQTSPKPGSEGNEPNQIPTPPAAKKALSGSILTGRKTWTLRKFKRSMSTSSTSSTSTFYLTPTGVANTPDTKISSDRPSEESSRVSNVTDSISDNTLTRRLNTPLRQGGLQNNVVRPSSPPPLPPLSHSGSCKHFNKSEKELSNTSWYAECGLFGKCNDSSSKYSSKLNKPISNSWYAAVGLWDSTESHTEESPEENGSGSSMSQGDISTNENNHGKTISSFPDEPLYQFYIGCIAEMAQCDAEGKFDSDGYEEIRYRNSNTPLRPTAMELIKPKEGQHRTLWCEIPEVVGSQVLSTLSVHQKKLQEAKFEIITSEASYMNSLNVLENHFMSSAELNNDSVLSRNDRRILFGNVLPVKTCCEKFLADLEKCWQDNILLHGVCDIICTHASNFFSVYIKYCSNQIYLDRTLRRLKDHQGQFADILTSLERSPNCQLLSLHSFLMLPMQRITRLPLLVDAVLTRLDPKDDEYQSCQLALATLNKVVQQCNEGARHMERMEQILILNRHLEFPKDVKHVPIISSSRYLVRSGEVLQLIWRGDDAKLTFGKKFSKASIHLFLFSDLLVIAKKKSEKCFAVIDHCSRNLVQISCSEGGFRLPVKSMDAGRNLMILTLLQNHENKTVEMVLSCPGESDRQRWYEALSQPTSENPDERVYEEWDCPQVVAVHSYTASQPDELSLDVSDVVNVLRKMNDGWYQGERIRDGEKGWFPGNYCVEIASAHVRARNLKQRYRLLALSGNFLDSRNKPKGTK